MRPPQNCHCGRKMVCLSIVPPWDIWGCPNDCKPGQDKSCDDDWESQEVQDPTPNFATIKVVKGGWGPGINVTFPTGAPPKPKCPNCGGTKRDTVPHTGTVYCMHCLKDIP